MLTATGILASLDASADSFTFPMLDNGYLYLAAGRVSVFAAPPAWALAFEIFGFSPRAGDPDTTIFTFSNVLRDRDSPDQYASSDAYDACIRNNQHNECRRVFPVESGDWKDAEDGELVAAAASRLSLRGRDPERPPPRSARGRARTRWQPEPDRAAVDTGPGRWTPPPWWPVLT